MRARASGGASTFTRTSCSPPRDAVSLRISAISRNVGKGSPCSDISAKSEPSASDPLPITSSRVDPNTRHSGQSGNESFSRPFSSQIMPHAVGTRALLANRCRRCDGAGTDCCQVGRAAAILSAGGAAIVLAGFEFHQGAGPRATPSRRSALGRAGPSTSSISARRHRTNTLSRPLFPPAPSTVKALVCGDRSWVFRCFGWGERSRAAAVSLSAQAGCPPSAASAPFDDAAYGTRRCAACERAAERGRGPSTGLRSRHSPSPENRTRSTCWP